MRIQFVSAALSLALGIGAAVGTSTSADAQTWTAGASAPTPYVRGTAVWFPSNGRLYILGGRTADTAGSDLLSPSEYNPGTNTWAAMTAVFPSNQVNNMAGGVLTDAGTPYIYVVGGSAAGAATSTPTLKRYDPIADVITVVATDPWPAPANTLPGSGVILNNKLYVIGGFTISVSMSSQIWEFDPAAAAGTRWTLKASALTVPVGYVPANAIGGLIYIAGGATFVSPGLFDSADSYVYDPVADLLTPIAPIPRAVGETRAVAQKGQLWVLGGGRTLPNPSTQVDAFSPGPGTWGVATPMNFARRNIAADIDPATNTIFVVGGYTAANLPTADLDIFRGAPIVKYCAGDGTGTPCPCGNNSPVGPGAGCLHSLGTAGDLNGTGAPSIAADTLVLAGSGMPNSSALYFQGTTALAGGLGVTFGDGLRCAGGNIARLGTKQNAAGASQYPAAGDSSVSVRGNVTAPGKRRYQVWYRNAAAFCTSDTFNLTNGLEVIWQL